MKRSIVVIVLVAIASQPARADDTDDLIAKAIDLRKINHDQEALPLLVKAAAEQPSPRVLAHLGTCEQALGLWIQAEAHIQAALAVDADPWIKKNEPALRKALEVVQSRIGSLELWGSPAGAKVSIDGDMVSTLPMTRPVRALLGSRTVSVSAPGFVTESQQIEVRKGVYSVREHVVLKAIALLPKAMLHPPPNEPEITTATVNISSNNLAEPASKPIYKRWWFWSAIALTTIAAGTTIILVSRHNDSCAAPMGGTCTTF